jgi:hypothetical protein
VRNWNQSPRSHSGWDRRVFLHEWWSNPENKKTRDVFIKDLSAIYSKYTSDNDFLKAWGLILKSDQVMQRRVAGLKNKIRTWGEIRFFKTLKYFIKRSTKPQSLPATVSELCKEMEALNIFIPQLELQRATALVSKLLPYESW